jgi:hypothetical protein
MDAAYEEWLLSQERLAGALTLTDCAQRAIGFALDELERDASSSIPDAVLWEALRQEKVGYCALDRLGVDMGGLLVEVANRLHASQQQPPRNKKLVIPVIVGLAAEEAIAFEHDWVGTEHLLLAIMRAPAGRTVPPLLDLGITVEQVRKAVSELLGPR